MLQPGAEPAFLWWRQCVDAWLVLYSEILLQTGPQPLNGWICHLGLAQQQRLGLWNFLHHHQAYIQQQGRGWTRNVRF